MPNIGSYANQIRDWQRLLAAATENSASLGDEDLRTELAEHLEATVALKASQDSLQASRQRRTQELTEMLNHGRELAMRLRGLAKARIGPRNEQISQFGVAPLRPRSRKSTTSVPNPPAKPPTGTPEPPARPEGSGTPQ